MTVRGQIRKGKVLLEDPHALAEGTEVEVRPVKKRKPAARPAVRRGKAKAKGRPRSLAERYASLIGKARGLPSDMSENHDHYLYGVPKQS